MKTEFEFHHEETHFDAALPTNIEPQDIAKILSKLTDEEKEI